MRQWERTTCINHTHHVQQPLCQHAPMFPSAKPSGPGLLLPNWAATRPSNPEPGGVAWVTVCRHRDGPKCLLLLSKHWELKKKIVFQNKSTFTFCLPAYKMYNSCKPSSFFLQTFSTLCIAKKKYSEIGIKWWKWYRKNNPWKKKKMFKKNEAFFVPFAAWQDHWTTQGEVTFSV